MKCMVVGCNNRSNVKKNGKSITFSRFPYKDATRSALWLYILNLENLKDTDYLFEYARICCEHFRPEDYIVINGRPRLNCNAVPCIFNGIEMQQHLKKRRFRTPHKPIAEVIVKEEYSSDESVVELLDSDSEEAASQSSQTTQSNSIPFRDLLKMEALQAKTAATRESSVPKTRKVPGLAMKKPIHPAFATPPPLRNSRSPVKVQTAQLTKKQSQHTPPALTKHSTSKDNVVDELETYIQLRTPSSQSVLTKSSTNNGRALQKRSLPAMKFVTIEHPLKSTTFTQRHIGSKGRPTIVAMRNTKTQPTKGTEPEDNVNKLVIIKHPNDGRTHPKQLDLVKRLSFGNAMPSLVVKDPSLSYRDTSKILDTLKRPNTEAGRSVQAKKRLQTLDEQNECLIPNDPLEISDHVEQTIEGEVQDGTNAMCRIKNVFSLHSGSSQTPVPPKPKDFQLKKVGKLSDKNLKQKKGALRVQSVSAVPQGQLNLPDTLSAVQNSRIKFVSERQMSQLPSDIIITKIYLPYPAIKQASRQFKIL